MNPEWLMPQSRRPDRGMDVIRVAAAAMMLIHGLTRLYLHGIPVFGAWLSSQGLPLGTAISASVTLFEIGGAVLLLARKAVVPACLGFVGTLTSGIILIHGREGWFVVGAGRNGMEFSVLLIASFAAVAWSHWPKRDNPEKEARA